MHPCPRFATETYSTLRKVGALTTTQHLILCKPDPRQSLLYTCRTVVAVWKMVPQSSNSLINLLYLFSSWAFTYPAAEGIWVSPRGASLWSPTPFPHFSNCRKDSSLTLSLMISALWASSASCTFSSQFFVSAAKCSSQNGYICNYKCTKFSLFIRVSDPDPDLRIHLELLTKAIIWPKNTLFVGAAAVKMVIFVTKNVQHLHCSSEFRIRIQVCGFTMSWLPWIWIC